MIIISCTLETSDNGKLDGYWQLSSIDTLANGHSVNMRDSGIFWGVQNDLIIIRATQNNKIDVLFRFKHTADSLVLYNPYISNRDSSDILLTDYSLLNRLCIFNNNECFIVREINSNKMILTSDMFRLWFRKY